MRFIVFSSSSSSSRQVIFDYSSIFGIVSLSSSFSAAACTRCSWNMQVAFNTTATAATPFKFLVDWRKFPRSEFHSLRVDALSHSVLFVSRWRRGRFHRLNRLQGRESEEIHWPSSSSSSSSGNVGQYIEMDNVLLGLFLETLWTCSFTLIESGFSDLLKRHYHWHCPDFGLLAILRKFYPQSSLSEVLRVSVSKI